MIVPKVKKRRYYDSAEDRRKMPELNDYMEGDSNYVENNLAACVWFLDNRDKINALIKGRP